MGVFAALVGKFIGAALAECGPVLSEIISNAIKSAFTSTVEDGARRDDLRERLLARLHKLPDGPGGTGGTSPTP